MTDSKQPTGQPIGDQARISPGLIGFYASCAAVSLGAAIFFFALFVLTRPGYGSVPLVMKILGGLMMAVGLPGAWVCLRLARAPKKEA